jgi:transposase
MSWSLPALRMSWNAAKAEVAPWWPEVSKEAFNTGLDALARGLKHWADSRRGQRAGRRVGLPRFKSRRRTSPSVRFTTGAIRVESDRMHVVLPRLGRLKLHESARKLARRLDNGTGPIMSATVGRVGGGWHVSYTVEVERAVRTPARLGSSVGVDVGIKHLAVLSTGELVANPRHLGDAQRRLRGLGRSLSSKDRPGPQDRPAPVEAVAARRRPPRSGARPGREPALRRPAQTHHRADPRARNRRGGRPQRHRHAGQPQAGPPPRRRGLRRDPQATRGQDHLQWRPADRGRSLVSVLETCSGCGTVKTKLALSEREYTCQACGLVLDRDLNAACNLAVLAAQFDTAGSGPVAGRGANQKTRFGGQVAVRRQPGTASACQTGTVAPHGGTIDRVLTRAH